MNGAALYARLPLPLQNLACTYAGWRRHRGRFTPHFSRTLAMLQQSDGSPVEDLYAIQQRRLLELVGRARQFVPHYRAQGLPHFAASHDARKGIEEILDCFAVLEKDTYRGDPESFVAEDRAPDRLLEGKTSGTTGSALPLWYTAASLAEEYAVVWRLRNREGVRLRNPHFTFGGQLICPVEQAHPPFWRRNAWSNQTLFSLYHMTSENLSAYIEAMHELPALYIEGYPSSMHRIARAMLDSGRTLPSGRVRAIFPSSESLLAFQREDIEAAFGARIFDRYGTSEFAVSMTGCAEGNLHLDMEFGIVEVDVVEESADSVSGPLLVTGFANDATPFIRYRIGDTGTRSKHPCPCGRPGEVFLDVDGRIEDYVVTPDGRWVGRMDHVFKEQLAVAEAQILQEDASCIEVLLVPRPGFDASAEEALRAEFRSRLGMEIGIDFRVIEEIPREANGKFRAVKSTVGSNAG
ncbi:MAG: hypothetical protein CL908_18330 [Deltaproteobacteria bacterium]|nr:hypothetical protein [Deltaproteobacteria bacterium]